ncbi:hypothetical protein [Chryseolinea lacunae]|uniref:Uncharacterized protein n=1 Tax=Chryseolinea lacunae TaxID=2801331 RepID=A0ABS1L2F4_9BACT|nr:hypothetical protein [Chryseolinea lacunae]MBL0745869.1 hypothetical protein [Chryseolinea lacunae]
MKFMILKGEVRMGHTVIFLVFELNSKNKQEDEKKIKTPGIIHVIVDARPVVVTTNCTVQFQTNLVHE